MIKEFENKKVNLEQAFEEKKKQAQALTNDIVLLEQLIMKKNELNKIMSEMQAIEQVHTEVCKVIEEEKAKEKAENEEVST